MGLELKLASRQLVGGGVWACGRVALPLLLGQFKLLLLIRSRLLLVLVLLLRAWLGLARYFEGFLTGL